LRSVTKRTSKRVRRRVHAGEADIMSYKPYHARPGPRGSTPIEEMDVEAFAAYTDISSAFAGGGFFPESLHVSTGCFPSSPRASSLLWSTMPQVGCDCDCVLSRTAARLQTAMRAQELSGNETSRSSLTSVPKQTRCGARAPGGLHRTARTPARAGGRRRTSTARAGGRRHTARTGGRRCTRSCPPNLAIPGCNQYIAGGRRCMARAGGRRCTRSCPPNLAIPGCNQCL